MQVWKRRIAVLVAVAAGGAGLMMSSAGAQTPPDFPEFPDFTFPDFTIPDFSVPPPTMPPPTTSTTSPPPTMPPTSSPTTSPPPTMPPSTIPNVDDAFEEFFEDLINRLEDGSEVFEELRDLVDEIIADFGN